MSRKQHTHTYYADFGQLGEDIEVVVKYHTYPGFAGTNEEPAEPAGMEVDSIDAADIGCLMGIYNQDGPFAADVNQRIAEEHEEQ